MRFDRLMAVCLPLAAGGGDLVAATPIQHTVAIVGATVVHPERDANDASVPNSTIVIRGTRIVAVGPTASVRVPNDAEIIDGAGKWVIPGLIDAHVHFFQSGNVYTRPDALDLNSVVKYADEVARNKARLAATFKVWIASGVTAVVDVGGPMWNFDVRRASRTAAVAPRVAVAGPLVSMIADTPLELDDPPIIKAESPADARRIVAKQMPQRPDYIKVWFIYRKGADLRADEQIVRAAGLAAHAAGVPLAVHATELVTAKAALRAGADYLVHSVEDAPVDAEFLALMKKNKALYCPTLWVGPGYAYTFAGLWKPTDAELRLADPQVLATMGDLAKVSETALPPRIAAKMAAAKPPPPPEILLRNLKAVHDAGIPVVMGTDAGNIGSLHGPSVFREMALMQQAGLRPLEVLRAATVTGARAARLQGQVGKIAVGMLADLVVLDADPLVDIANASRIVRVVSRGNVVDPDELIAQIR